MEFGDSDSCDTNSSNSDRETPALHLFSSSILAEEDSGEKYWKGDSLSSKLCILGTTNLPFNSGGVTETSHLDTGELSFLATKRKEPRMLFLTVKLHLLFH